MAKLLGLTAAAAAGAAAFGIAAVSAGADEPTEDPSPMIIGGEEAEEGQFPWMVSVGDAEYGDFCGGSMVTEQIVLTAAHCVEYNVEQGTDLIIKYGSIDLENPDLLAVASTDIYMAPYYNGAEYTGDWAVVELAEPIEGAATLPIADTPDHEEGDFQVMGWGLTEDNVYPTVLRYATVPFVDDETCAEGYGSSLVPDAHLCAGYVEDGGIDSCSGDSGGPMIAGTEADGYVQVGIVSWGNDCALAGYPGVYTQVSSYAADIAEAIAELEGTGARS